MQAGAGQAGSGRAGRLCVCFKICQADAAASAAAASADDVIVY